MRAVRQPDGNERQVPVPIEEYRALRWNLGTLAAGQSEQVQARVRVNTALPPAAGGRGKCRTRGWELIMSASAFRSDWLRRLAACFAPAFLGVARLQAPPRRRRRPALQSATRLPPLLYRCVGRIAYHHPPTWCRPRLQQVASLTLTQNGAQNATAGSVTYYPHTLTKHRNGSDTFNLTTPTPAVHH